MVKRYHVSISLYISYGTLATSSTTLATMTLSNLSPDGKAVLEVVKTLLASLTLKDIILFNSTLDPKGLFVNVRHATRNTVLYNDTNGGIQKYLDVIWHSDKKFEECIDESRELVVPVDDDIATVWAPFWVQ